MNNETEKLGSLKEIQKILEISEEKTFSAGNPIFKEGDTNPYFYIILKGDVEISKITAEGKQKVFAHIGAGEFLGEGALSGSVKKPATAMAVTDVSVLVISIERFEELMQKEPKTVVDFLLSVLESANKRLSDTNIKLMALYEINRLIRISGEDLNKLASGIIERLLSLTESQDGAFLLKNPFSSEYRVIHSSSQQFGEKAIGYDLNKTGNSEDESGKYICFNLKDLGAIILRRGAQESAFSPSDEKLIMLVADQAAGSIKDASDKASEKARKMLERKRFEI